MSGGSDMDTPDLSDDRYGVEPSGGPPCRRAEGL